MDGLAMTSHEEDREKSEVREGVDKDGGIPCLWDDSVLVLFCL